MNRSVPILYVTGSLQHGGTERHLAYLLPRLDRKKFKPVLFVTGFRGHLASELEAQGIRIVAPWWPSMSNDLASPLRALRLTVMACQLFVFLLSFRPTIAHFFLPRSYMLAAPFALLARIPRTIMSRRSLNNYQQQSPMAARFEKKLHGRMSNLLANSQAVRRQLAAEAGIGENQVDLIYNGIDTEAFAGSFDKEKTRRSIGISPDAMVFVVVANLIPYKGHRNLIAAFGRIRRYLPDDWCLLVVGRDDGIGANLKAEASASGLSDHIRFLGIRPDIPDLLRLADIGLLTSEQEGFSNAILEGMAAGLPMIVTDVGGNAEAVIDGKTGLVVSPGDVNGLATAIRALTDDSELRERMSQAGRRRVHDRFTIERCVEDYERLYMRMLGTLN